MAMSMAMAVGALSWCSWCASQHPAVQTLCIPEKRPTILPFCRPLLAFVRRKQTVVRDHISPQKPPGSRLWFSPTRVQHSPSSSTIELPSALDRVCNGSLARAVAPYRHIRLSVTVLCVSVTHLNGTKLILERGASGGHHPQPTKLPLRLNPPEELNRLNRIESD